MIQTFYAQKIKSIFGCLTITIDCTLNGLSLCFDIHAIITNSRFFSSLFLGDIDYKKYANTDFDVENVLRQAQEMLKNVATSNEKYSNLAKQFPQSIHISNSAIYSKPNTTTTATTTTSSNTVSPDKSVKQSSSTTVTPFKNSHDIMQIKKEAAAKNLRLETTASDFDMKSSQKKHLLTRTDSNSSINLLEDKPSHHTDQLDQLREENELLNIKINKIRYDLKARDSTVDDLKHKIAQMYVDLEASQMSRKQVQLDVETLKNDNFRLNNEKLSYYEQLKQTMREHESAQSKIHAVQLAYAEQGLQIGRHLFS